MNRLLLVLSCLLPFYTIAGVSVTSKRILTLGIRHESNTFSTGRTKLADFQIKRGREVLKEVAWARLADSAGVELIPTLHAYAWPGGVVERNAFDLLKNEILEAVRKSGRLDGIYMEMHGALHVEGYADAQETLTREIRMIVGPQVLISASFDLHGNISPGFVAHLNLLTAYRTAPHRDIEETKERAMRLLLDALDKNLHPQIASVTIPILVPGEKSTSDEQPLRSFYEALPAFSEKEGILDASILVGYCWADLPRSAMRVFVLASDRKFVDFAQREAEKMADQIWAHRAEMQIKVPSGSFAAMWQKARRSKAATVFISDSGDNTTAGAPGDNTTVLNYLLEQKARNVLVAGIVDPQAFEICRDKKVGDSVSLQLGGKVDYSHSTPVKIKAKLLAKSPDSSIDTKRGSVLVDMNGLHVAILNNRRSFTELRDFTDLAIDPLSYKVVIVKLGYLFPQLNKIAPESLMALTTGFCNLDIARLPFKQVHHPSYPVNEKMKWKAEGSELY